MCLDAHELNVRVGKQVVDLDSKYLIESDLVAAPARTEPQDGGDSSLAPTGLTDIVAAVPTVTGSDSRRATSRAGGIYPSSSASRRLITHQPTVVLLPEGTRASSRVIELMVPKDAPFLAPTLRFLPETHEYGRQRIAFFR